MKIFEVSELTEQEKERTKHYFEMQHKIYLFEISCTHVIFIALFGEKEGSRLRDHFVNSCEGSLTKWFTYVTQDQKTFFWVQLMKYTNLAKQIL